MYTEGEITIDIYIHQLKTFDKQQLKFQIVVRLQECNHYGTYGIPTRFLSFTTEIRIFNDYKYINS